MGFRFIDSLDLRCNQCPGKLVKSDKRHIERLSRYYVKYNIAE